MNHPKTRTIALKPFPGMQERACTSPADELLLGGMAGPGKSWVLLFMDIPDIMRFPDMRILFLRRETPDLGQLIQDAKEMYLPLGARFTSQHPDYKRAAFIFPRFTPEGRPIPGTEGAIAVFGHCQREDDKEKYSGFEFQRLRIDEVQQFTESMYLFLFSRIRTDNPRMWCNIRCSCNPNGIGMLWLKRRFVDKVQPGTLRWFRRVRNTDTEVRGDDPLALSRSWLPGDRKENLALGQDYEAMLAQLSERDHAALAMGLWEMPRLAGQLVDPAWWDRAIAGTGLGPEALGHKVKAFGCDFAHRGDDTCCLAWGSGRRLMGMHSWKTDSSQEFAWHVWRRAEDFGGASRVVVGVDSNGPGTGAADLLETGGVWMDGKNERKFGKIQGLNRCTHKDDRFEARFRGAMRFDSFRAQMWWKFREDLRNGRVDLSWLADPDQGFQQVDDLAEEVLAHTYSSDAGIFQMITKKALRKAENLGRSPDLADALVIWNWVREYGGGTASPDDSEWDKWTSIDPYMKNFREEMDPDEHGKEPPTLC